MKTKILIIGIIFLLISNYAISQNTVSTSKVWYAPLLKKYFPNGIDVLRVRIKLNNFPCLPKDITKFNVVAKKVNSPVGPAFQITGTLGLSKIVPPFYKFFEFIKRKEYLLIIKAYMFSPGGKILWQQKGYAIGDSWIPADGDTVKFKLINAFRGSTNGCTLLILAIGDISMSDYDESRTILGVKKISL